MNLEGVEFDFVDVDEDDALEEVVEVILKEVFASHEVVVDGQEDRLLPDEVEKTRLLRHL